MKSDDEKEKQHSIEVIEPTSASDEKQDESEDEEALHSVEAADNEPTDTPKDSDKESPRDAGKIKRFFHAYWRKKVWTLPLTILVLVGLIFLIPATRYPVLAAAGVKRQFIIVVNDSKTHTSVSGAKVTLDGTTVTTDKVGTAKFNVKVGSGTLKVEKQYYASSAEKVFVGVTHKSTNARVVDLVATGRQVPIAIVNKISGIPVANAVVKVLDTSATTDLNGKAIIVLPTQSSSYKATITAPNYNDLSGSVQVTDSAVAANTFKMIPSGRVYFLSDQSGNIDVVSTNLDGTARKTVLAGTGNEDQNNTVLLASRDWKYLALLSKRDDGKYAKLYLIDTTNGGKLTTMDDDNGTFTAVGWSDHNFVYTETSASLQSWQSGQQMLKSYNAVTKKITVIDKSTAIGDVYSSIGTSIAFTNIVKDRIIYGMTWAVNGIYGDKALGGHKNTIYSVDADGSNKTDLKDITIPSTTDVTAGYNYTWLGSVVKDPDSLYIQSTLNSNSNALQAYYIYQYDINSADQSNLVSADIYNKTQQSQITYLASPSNNRAFWYTERDGKNAIFIGNYDSSSPTQIASSDDLIPYGWYTDSYVLLEKNGSELYVMSSTPNAKPIKISDYYKPAHSIYGYGGGYGGL